MNLSCCLLLLLGVVAFCHATQQISFVSVNGDGSEGEPQDNDAHCKDPCDKKFTDEEKRKECFEGCRLVLIYRFFDQNTEDEHSAVSNCKDGCARAFQVEGRSSIDTCSEGCGIQTEMSPNSLVRLELTDKDATFDVASEFVNDPMNAIAKDLEWSLEKINGKGKDVNDLDDIFGGFGDTEDPIARFFKQFETARRRMENSFRAFETDPFFNSGKSVKVDRPSGHELASFNGKPVGNEDIFGNPIIQSQVIPDFNEKSDNFNGQQLIHTFKLPSIDEDEFAQRIRETEQLAIRNERIAQISHYGVKVILIILFIVILLVALAMLRHHSMMTYRHLNEKTFFATAAAPPKADEAGPLPAKSAENVYVTAPVHGSPPPAYDQLSIKKVQHP
uniref:Uncharacterized protein n=1 Tax=Steinernema glaseri TaxID=37863 RepID=A0A1I7ZHW6_9BILA